MGYSFHLIEIIAAELTPLERLNAMTQLKTQSSFPAFMTNKWFVVLGWSLIAILLILLFVVRRMVRERERIQAEERFKKMSDRCHLSQQEREVLEAVSLRTGLKSKDMIFTESLVFDDGLARLMQDCFEKGHDLVQRKRLNVMAYGIKTKLGFQKSHSSYGSEKQRPGHNLSTRQISLGKSVMVALASGANAVRYEAVVTLNDEYELALSSKHAMEATPGQRVWVQYKIGSVTWEFDAMVIACSSQGLELNHTDRIRYVNRRRFPRIPVQKQASIAVFDVLRTIPSGSISGLDFHSAVVTEIAGPGLRVRSSMEVKTGDRVIVIFELEKGLWIQDIAEVRGVRETPLGISMGVEMIGLNEKTVDEMIRVTTLLSAQYDSSLEVIPEEDDLLEPVTETVS